MNNHTISSKNIGAVGIVIERVRNNDFIEVLVNDTQVIFRSPVRETVITVEGENSAAWLHDTFLPVNLPPLKVLHNGEYVPMILK